MQFVRYVNSVRRITTYKQITGIFSVKPAAKTGIMTSFPFMGLHMRGENKRAIQEGVGGRDWPVIHDRHTLLASAPESELFPSTS